MVLEQLVFAPRDIYTRVEDTKKSSSHEQANERTGLLADEQTTYSSVHTNDVQPLPKFAIGEIVDEGRALEDEMSPRDPLIGKLFGKSASAQIRSSWFW